MAPASADLEAFRSEVDAFCRARFEPRRRAGEQPWGEGSDAMVVIEESDPVQERLKVQAARSWRRLLDQHGLVWIGCPVEHGGRGLSADHVDARA